MEQKPNFFDGSIHYASEQENITSEQLEITEEMRKNIGINPYSLEAK